METYRQPSVLLIFIDGLGIGDNKNGLNPFVKLKNAEPLNNFQNYNSEVIFHGKLVPTNPRLGIEGRPQSASGQTTILTGINAPKLLGFHKQGFPNQILRDVISENSVFLQLRQRKIEPNIFVNAYSPQFFEQTPRWKSATTCAVEAAGIPFRRLPDLLGEKALFHDFTNQALIERGFNAPIFSTEKAGKILAEFTKEYCFTLYEHFITDKIGHARDLEQARIHLPQLAEFIRETLKRVDLENTTVILTSDHGNIEDLSVRTHTLNDVPTIIWGRKSSEAAKKVKDLADITPVIINLLS
jgi:2,3-bisphosphoglycerate-independent phosphoglycerate mutase